MASVVRKTLADTGTLSPKRYTTPKAKAMSVAIGIPHPIVCGVPMFRLKNIKAGTIIPPIAAPIGRMVFLMSASSPPINSLFNSKPTTKKNIAIKPSLIQWCRL